MDRPIIQALHDAVMTAKAVPAVAARLDRRPSTIYGALNPYQDPDNPRKHVLGVEEAVEIMRLIGDHTALHVMAGLCGFRLVAMDQTVNGRDMTHECHQAIQAAAQACDAADRGEPVESVAALVSKAHKELGDVLVRRQMDEKARQAGVRLVGAAGGR